MMLLFYTYIYVYPLLLHLYYLSSWQITGAIFEVKGVVGFQVVSFKISLQHFTMKKRLQNNFSLLDSRADLILLPNQGLH